MDKSKIPSLKTPQTTKTGGTIPKFASRKSPPKASEPSTSKNLPSFPSCRRLRRSKSFSDLKSTNFNDFSSKPPIRKYGIAQSLMKSSSNSDIADTARKAGTFKTNLNPIFENGRAGAGVVPKIAGVKRPAVTSTGSKASSEEPVVKAKVAKPMKPAPYDYKARFQLLNEKYTTLQQTFKDNKLRVLEFEKDLELYNSLKENYSRLKVEHDAVTKQNEEITSKHSELTRQLEDLNRSFESLQKDHEIIQQTCEKLQTDVKLLTSNKIVLENDLSGAKSKIEELEDTVQVLKSSVQSHEEVRRVMHNKIQDLKGTIRVFCRVRPSLTSEHYKMLCCINFLDEATLEIKKCKDSINCITGKLADLKLEFMFDKVFPPEATQAELFEELSQLVQSALDGYHICVFAYGQTGSGKTYTMQGDSADSQRLGMIPRTVSLIFSLIESLKRIGWTYDVQANFLEIYNETIRDLLHPNDKSQHEIYYNEGRGITVTNLTTKTIKSAEHLEYLMDLANKNRAVACTNYNEHSSRSHAITKIVVNGCNEEMGMHYVGSLNLVDLAGSESAKHTTSERIVETKNINKSLSTLGTVMSALRNKEIHIPYRNSKLTYLLQSCLGGNSKTLMIVNIAPFEECYNESVNALRFASTVKEVKLGSRRNKMYLQRELSNITKQS